MTVPTAPRIEDIKPNERTISKALIILRHSAPSNDAESQAVIQLLDIALRAGTPEINAIANYLAEAIVYNRVNRQHIWDAKNIRRQNGKR